MGSMFRSEEMSLVQMIIPTDAAYEVVGQLGELGIAQFRDLNPEVSAFQRHYVNEVRRCDEMERRVRFFELQLGKAEIPIPDVEEVPSEVGRSSASHPSPQQMDELEYKFTQLDKELKEINTNEEMLDRNNLELTELSHILRSTREFFEEAQTHNFDDNSAAAPGGRDEHASLLGDAEAGAVYGAHTVRVGFVAGAIPRERIPVFERVLWRATRGNAFLRHAPVDADLTDPTTNTVVPKSVFLVFFQGDQLEARVRKIAEGFSATIYPCPQTANERYDLGLQVAQRLQDLESVLKKTRDHRRRVLATVALQISSWSIQIKKIKGIFHTLNMFNIDASSKCLVSEAWVPNCFLPDMRGALSRATERSSSTIPPIVHVLATRLKPPTFHRLNKFTAGFQNIVDAYGVASYREVNPAPFAIITFPFLFAVMFGDFGHGFLMALAAWALIHWEKPLARYKEGGEIFDTFFGGRYIILLMGLFSIYTGLIYNDIFSRSVDFFGSGWDVPSVTKVVVGNWTGYSGTFNGTFYDGLTHNTSLPEDLYLDPLWNTHTYVFGMDPVWAMAENRLTFLNPYKMKMSVILGVCQMLFGIVLGVFNHTYFKRTLNIVCEFIPQVLFLLCIFGYLVLMIFYKWANFWPHSKAPSLLITLINMFLKFGNIETEDILYGAEGAQANLQSALVIIALMCVPWMLIPKPYLLIRANKRHAHAPLHDHDDQGHLLGGEEHAAPQVAAVKAADEPEEESHEPGEIIVHQCIHTIEFCLGCISNTASYLRLWALSLAHAQLSEVLWDMVMHAGFGNPALLFFAWGGWAFLTIAVLLIMEGLSAFLHALRLHWVEFQNKFYEGTGRKFHPFSFEALIKGQDEE
ncbi:ATPase [Capsaspora owczarzaki ATCC 30864]|uniref:V-type proton ATPase subunit a n=1 Tax=Capsaspora owczarzaki (strain ATCC 30864) TaxID=595528 RepID=A0A0D2X3Y2_CAPO3|nr:ATPase [Capsaspora owczarzaki ATCC 30864]KJE95104.1 ATPase [Capsaspora owczarzaki ATCC 30864]|eukprot:XP_004346266.1 ATPase [Capsaspora owczarzaki ATCC 30864]